MNEVLDNFDLLKTNIILCKDAHSSYEIIKKINEATDNMGIINQLLFLPSPVTHYSNFELEFKGKVLEYDRPFIFTQSKEFLEIILQIEGDIMKVLTSDFNVVQVSLKDGKLQYKTYSKEKARQLMIEKKIDLRNIT